MGNNPSIYEPDLRAEFDARRKERGFDYLVRLLPIGDWNSIGAYSGPTWAPWSLHSGSYFLTCCVSRLYRRYWTKFSNFRILCSESIL